MSKSKRPGIVGMLEKAIANQERILATLEGEDNPQLVEMRQKIEGRVEGYRNSLDALRGDTMFLRIDGGELWEVK